MNWLDKSIAFVSPSWAYRRMAWRSGMSLFDSGDRGRLNQNWNPAQIHDQNKMAAERGVIRARAQDLERNSDIAAAVISAFERNVVGDGMTLQARIPETVSNYDSLNKEVEELWKEFCQAENCDVTGTQSMSEMEEMIVRRYVVDGGIFVVKVYTKDKNFPFKIQIRSVDELNNTALLTGSGSQRIVEGVELDEHNKPLAYHFKKYSGLNLTQETVRIPAEDVIFFYRKLAPNQVREMSMLATALNRIRDANQFIEAVGVKERILACMAVFIKKATPSSLGRSARSTDAVDYNGISLKPGMVGELNPGDEVQTVVPTGQASNAREFITTLIRLIASGVGLSYEAVSRDLSMVNYSSARQGLIEDRKMYRKIQRLIGKKVLTAIYMEFLNSMYLAGKLNIPDFAKRKKEYAQHVWIPPGNNWIDPTKEVNANKTAVETFQDTLSRIAAERGEDWREVIKQRVAEIKFIKKLMGREGVSGEEEDELETETDDVQKSA